MVVDATCRYFQLGTLSEDTKVIWFVFHGYGMSAKSFLENFADFDNGYTVVISPEGPHRFYGGEQDGKQVVGNWMTREVRDADIETQQNFLNKILDTVLNSVARTGVKIGVLGFSQGSPAAFRWVSQLSTGVDMCISWGSDIARDVITDVKKLHKINLCNIQLVVGDRDKYISDERLNEELIELHDMGVQYDFHSFKGGHRLDDKTIRYFFGRLEGMNQEF